MLRPIWIQNLLKYVFYINNYEENNVNKFIWDSVSSNYK